MVRGNGGIAGTNYKRSMKAFISTVNIGIWFEKSVFNSLFVNSLFLLNWRGRGGARFPVLQMVGKQSTCIFFL